MILYHGSNTEIQKIDLSKSKPNKDFGKALHTNTLFVQSWPSAN